MAVDTDQLPPRFPPGALVHARGRDWIALPSDDRDLLLLRPLGGTGEDVAGIYLPLEGDDVRSATLQPPDPRFVGDAVSASLLREAVRLGFRAAAGPLRSLGRIAVEPRPYQLVPLLMALKLDKVRLLIADDVGIGKTIEAGLIARELIDRGEVRRLTVLCPPQLCEQWQAELSRKFHIEAVVVRPGTAPGLERDMERRGVSTTSHTIFDEFPYTVVSIDYIKGDRRRFDFIRTCPELVIVDEAHSVAEPGARSGAQHQRHQLVRDIAKDADRHLILVTATPHSGDQDAFASLVGLLRPDLRDAVANLEFRGGTQARDDLARHFVQRRRGDIRQYLDRPTDFPERKSAEKTYKLTPEYRSLLQRVLDYARELVKSTEGGTAFQQRVSWWAALALLRCVSSSPAAAAEALKNRAPQPETRDPRDMDRLGMAAAMDMEGSDEATNDDTTPGADTTPEDEPESSPRRYLLSLARDAQKIAGTADPKLAEAERIIRELLADGFRPIVFCRYVATAKYVGDELRRRLKDASVEVVTGEMPPEEREERAEAMEAAESPVLVATDCLSEGVNLQRAFNAVVHYDLAWNPTRHEQREGRVDRYGQPSREVRTVMLYGQDNRVDGVVLEVLLRKADNIRKTLGVSVPVPADAERVLEAIFDKLFDRPSTDFQQLELFVTEQERKLDVLWKEAGERERRTHSVFAQGALSVDQVRAELDQTLAAVGGAKAVERFVAGAFRRLGNPLSKNKDGSVTLDIDSLPDVVRGRYDAGRGGKIRAGFDSATLPKGCVYLERTHPLVEGLGSYLLDMALETPDMAKASRCGMIRTDAVDSRTVVLLLRGRYVIREQRGAEFRDLLGEEAILAAFTGSPDNAKWLPEGDVERLAQEALPVANIPPGQAQARIEELLGQLPRIDAALAALAHSRAELLGQAHRRVRDAARMRGVRQSVEAKLPMDLLGIYLLMPAPVVA